MPELKVEDLTTKESSELDAMRRAIVTKAAGNYENLAVEDLHSLLAITAALRLKGKNGPPKVAKTPKAKAAPLTTLLDI